MRTIAAGLKAKLQSGTINLCRVVSLQLPSGDTFYYTDNAQSVWISGVEYKPAVEVSAIRGNEDGPTGNATLSVLYDVGGLTEERTRNGGLDAGTFVIDVVDYTDTAAGRMRLAEGRVSAINTSNQFAVGLDISPYAIGSLVLGENYSQRCRNVFGDDRCKVDKEALSSEFAVTAVETNGVQFRIDLPVAGSSDRTEYISGSMPYYAAGSYEFTVPDADVVTFDLSSSGGGAGESVDHIGYNWDSFQSFIAGDNGENGKPAQIGRTAGGREVAWTWGGTAGVRTYYDGQHPDWTLEQISVGPLYGSLNAYQSIDFVPFGGGAGGKGVPLIKYQAQFARYYSGFNSAGQNATNGHRLLVSILVGVPGGLVKGEKLYVTVPAGGRGGGDSAGSPATGLPGGGAFPPALDASGAGGGGGAAAGPTPTLTGDDGTNGLPGAAGSVVISWAGNKTIQADNYVIGTVKWITGDNAGAYSTISTNSIGGVTLSSPTRAPIQVGDRGRLEPGCTNYADMCENRYNNLINMQAEPVVPQGASSAPSPETTTTADPSKPPPSQETVYYSTPTANYAKA